MDPIVFIDTNILLDFYRIRRGDISLEYLKQIEEHRESIILTSQVEMEYKKNRQVVILDSLKQMKDDFGNFNVPSILSDSQPAKMVKKHKAENKKQQKVLKERIGKILKSPSYSDKVFQTLNRIFKKNWNLHLNRTNKERFRIRKLAIKRFSLGYPPRKKNDTSIGDAVNWEWIIDCAIKTGKDIILVSRDGDFGMTYDKESFLNDWLLKEFKERVSTHRKIILTESLSFALKAIESNVTEEMETEEQKFIDYSKKLEMELKKRKNELMHKFRILWEQSERE